MLDLCTQYKLSGKISSIFTGDTSFAAWPFIVCMEENDGDPSFGQSCFEKNMNSSSLTWQTVSDCANNEADIVQAAAAVTTAPLKHTYVPWCVVDNELLQNTNLLQRSVCNAYTGPPPPSCGAAALQAAAEAPTKRSRATGHSRRDWA